MTWASLKLRVQNTIMMIAEEIVNYNNFKIACKKFLCNYFNEFLWFPILKERVKIGMMNGRTRDPRTEKSDPWAEEWNY